MAGPPVRYPELRDADWLREQLERGHDTISLAREVGCSDVGVGKALKRYGLTVNGHAGRPAGPGSLLAEPVERGLDPGAVREAAMLVVLLDEGATWAPACACPSPLGDRFGEICARCGRTLSVDAQAVAEAA